MMGKEKDLLGIIIKLRLLANIYGLGKLNLSQHVQWTC